MLEANITYIDTNALLHDACERLKASDVIGVDTEFFRETTYYPVPALVQIGSGSDVFLIDCLSIDCWQPLSELMLDASVLKLLHSCSEDMEVFYQILGVLPKSMIDTQIAAALAGLGFSLGYQNLVKRLLDIELDKEQTRSNWLQRPLSAAQLQYASNDVLWLPELWSKLSAMLEAQGRSNWVKQDCEKLLAEPVPSTVSPDLAYLRLKSAWRLNRCELNIIRALCAWREKRAQEKDVPRSRILTDSCTLELAKRAPKSLQSLQQIDSFNRGLDKSVCEQILALIHSAKSAQPDECPEKMPDRSEPNYRNKLKALRSLVATRAEALMLPPEVLGRRRELEKLIESPESSEVMGGWRADLLADEIAQII